MSMADEITLDLEDLRHLHSIANRPRTLSLLSSEIRTLEKDLALGKTIGSGRRSGDLYLLMKENSASAAVSLPKPIPVATKVPSVPSLSYSTISSFSWDQDDNKVKIYLSLEGVKEEKMGKNIKPMSLELKFHGVQGKNYQFAIPKLNKEIVPEQCKVLIKPTRVVITLVKASKGNWLDLHYKEDKLKPNLDKEKDPMAGIMDLMKNMYEEGDEEMKKTIAKAWSDARSGKTADPLKGYP